MFWLFFTLVSWALALWLLRGRGLVVYWPAGLVAALVVYVMDSTGTLLGAYAFLNTPLVNGVPILYLISALALGMLTLRFYPRENWQQLAYIGVLAGLFLIPEYLMLQSGNFVHLRGWHLGKSYLLNVFGFIIITWLSTRLGVHSHDRSLDRIFLK